MNAGDQPQCRVSVLLEVFGRSFFCSTKIGKLIPITVKILEGDSRPGPGAQGWSAVRMHQGCGFAPRSGHTQESTTECEASRLVCGNLFCEPQKTDATWDVSSGHFCF